MYSGKGLLPEGERAIVFLTEDETARRDYLLSELKKIEKRAAERHREHLARNTDPKLTELAEGLSETSDLFCQAVRDKLEQLIKPHGKLVFAVWVWSWSIDNFRDLVSGWSEVYEYEVETAGNYRCTVLTETDRSGTWAQLVYNSFSSVRALKQQLGLNINSEDVNKIVFSIAREFIPLKFIG